MTNAIIIVVSLTVLCSFYYAFFLNSKKGGVPRMDNPPAPPPKFKGPKIVMWYISDNDLRCGVVFLHQLVHYGKALNITKLYYLNEENVEKEIVPVIPEA